MEKKKDPPGGEHYDDREIDARSIVRYAAALAVVTVAALALTVVLRQELSRTEQAGQMRHHPPRLVPEHMFQQRPRLARRAHICQICLTSTVPPYSRCG